MNLPKINTKHLNNGNCLKCLDILKQFNGVDKRISDWFVELQGRLPEVHVSYAGRGKKDQEDFYAKKTSNAKWGESPHNYGLACDVFRLTPVGIAEFSVEWYTTVIAPEIKKHDYFVWGGDWKKFKDFPHLELTEWKALVKSGDAKLVE